MKDAKFGRTLVQTSSNPLDINIADIPDDTKEEAFKEFVYARNNGDQQDSPLIPFPKDGEYVIKIVVENGTYKYCLDYVAGSGDLIWFGTKDFNYSLRIEQEEFKLRQEKKFAEILRAAGSHSPSPTSSYYLSSETRHQQRYVPSEAILEKMGYHFGQVQSSERVVNFLRASATDLDSYLATLTPEDRYRYEQTPSVKLNKICKKIEILVAEMDNLADKRLEYCTRLQRYCSPAEQAAWTKITAMISRHKCSAPSISDLSAGERYILEIREAMYYLEYLPEIIKASFSVASIEMIRLINEAQEFIPPTIDNNMEYIPEAERANLIKFVTTVRSDIGSLLYTNTSKFYAILEEIKKGSEHLRAAPDVVKILSFIKLKDTKFAKVQAFLKEKLTVLTDISNISKLKSEDQVLLPMSKEELESVQELLYETESEYDKFMTAFDCRELDTKKLQDKIDYIVGGEGEEEKKFISDLYKRVRYDFLQVVLNELIDLSESLCQSLIIGNFLESLSGDQNKRLFAFYRQTKLLATEKMDIENLCKNINYLLNEKNYFSGLRRKFLSDAYTTYDLTLISNLPSDGNPEVGKIYLERSGKQVKYVVLNTAGKKAEGFLEVDASADGGLTEEFLVSKKTKILRIISEKGHIYTKILDRIKIPSSRLTYKRGELGKGDYSKVIKGEYRNGDGYYDVVIKRILSGGFSMDWEREAKIIMELDSDYVVKLFGVADDPYIRYEPILGRCKIRFALGDKDQPKDDEILVRARNEEFILEIKGSEDFVVSKDSLVYPVIVKVYESESKIFKNCDKQELITADASLENHIFGDRYGKSLILEYMPKEALCKVLYGDGGDILPEQLSREQLLQMGIDIAKGIQFLHDNGIIHRDVSASNILIGGKYKAKITDFSLSKKFKEGVSVQRTTNIDCTAPYLAQEIAMAAGSQSIPYSKATDVYALGVILWELVPQRPVKDRRTPFEGLGNARVIATIKHGERLPIPDYCDQEYKELIEHCWSFNPDDRPSAAVVVRKLEAYKIKLLGLKTIKVPEQSLPIKEMLSSKFGWFFGLQQQTSQIGMEKSGTREPTEVDRQLHDTLSTVIACSS